jgi:hypothetical protein
MTTLDQQPQLKLHHRIVMKDEPNYIPVDAREDEKNSPNYNNDDNDDKNTIENCDDNIMSTAEATSNFGLGSGIDYDAVEELLEDINELRKGLLGLLLLFVIITGVFALDDYYSYKKIANDEEHWQNVQPVVDDLGLSKPPHPHMGHKLQINASAFTVNDFECLQLDTGNWPSERVHCELLPSFRENINGVENSNDSDNDDDDVARYSFVVEHFDDEHCQEPNADNPIVRHTASGCYYFEGYNHSYNDLCHMNRTLTVSAFYGPGCRNPMPVTAVNIVPEDGQQ